MSRYDSSGLFHSLEFVILNLSWRIVALCIKWECHKDWSTIWSLSRRNQTAPYAIAIITQFLNDYQFLESDHCRFWSWAARERQNGQSEMHRQHNSNRIILNHKHFHWGKHYWDKWIQKNVGLGSPLKTITERAFGSFKEKNSETKWASLWKRDWKWRNRMKQYQAGIEMISDWIVIKNLKSSFLFKNTVWFVLWCEIWWWLCHYKPHVRYGKWSWSLLLWIIAIDRRMTFPSFSLISDLWANPMSILESPWKLWQSPPWFKWKWWNWFAIRKAALTQDFSRCRKTAFNQASLD
jgi:hypothetical protein